MPDVGVQDGVVEGQSQDSGQQQQNDGNVDGKRTQTPEPEPGQQNQEWERQRKGFINELQAERKARQDYEKKVAAFEAQLADRDRRLKAMAGFEEQSPEELDKAEIRSKLKKVVDREFLAEMLGVSVEDLDAVKSVKEQAAMIQETTRSTWDKHAKQMVGKLENEVLDQLGGDKLTDRQARKLQAAFAYFVDSNPEALQRFADGDETIIVEFAKEWAEDFFEPVKRRTTQQEVNRFRRVPNGRDRTTTERKVKEIDPTDDTALGEILGQGFDDRVSGGRRRG